MVSMDGVETFDLTTKTNEILNTVPSANYDVTYHYSSTEAQNDTNSITGTIQNTSNPQTIHVRVEDIDSGCLAFTTFDILVNPLPTIVDPTPLQVCDDNIADGLASIPLADKDDEITNGQLGLLVTYHSTQQDANTGQNPLAVPYNNVAAVEQLFVRVTDQNTGCASTTTLTIEVLENPVINTEDLYLDACDPEHDGFATFNLTDAEANILQGLTGVTVTYHETPEDAETGDNPIADPTSYDNIHTR